jgi:hypothetical protein
MPGSQSRLIAHTLRATPKTRASRDHCGRVSPKLVRLHALLILMVHHYRRFALTSSGARAIWPSQRRSAGNAPSARRQLTPIRTFQGPRGPARVKLRLHVEALSGGSGSWGPSDTAGFRTGRCCFRRSNADAKKVLWREADLGQISDVCQVPPSGDLAPMLEMNQLRRPEYTTPPGGI